MNMENASFTGQYQLQRMAMIAKLLVLCFLARHSHRTAALRTSCASLLLSPSALVSSTLARSRRSSPCPRTSRTSASLAWMVFRRISTLV
ncbi:hypothetical protein DFH11DRAFT_1637393 [Phellopilus nigrolimitatus]|nr:hypothetical protein DFH11DRAFT_1637393 [Phellopilus nigrolimitatus]